MLLNMLTICKLYNEKVAVFVVVVVVRRNTYDPMVKIIFQQWWKTLLSPQKKWWTDGHDSGIPKHKISWDRMPSSDRKVSTISKSNIHKLGITINFKLD